MVEVSSIISSNKVQAAVLSSVPCSEPKMEICKNDRVVSQKSNEMIIPMQQGGPSIATLLKGCNFSKCNATFTGNGQGFAQVLKSGGYIKFLHLQNLSFMEHVV